MHDTYSLRYPRRALLRTPMRLAAAGLMKLLTRTTVTGRDNLPKTGPLILVGNHAAMIEVVLMLLHVPWLIEIMGVGDVPLDPLFAPLIRTYGYIPINRGSIDRSGMNMALDVLKQGGVVGIFPEGGIWETQLQQARTGVAWLSSKAGAPIVPIGFGGMTGAIGAILRLRRPRLTMNIGEPIPPIKTDNAETKRKQALAEGAALIMARIEALIPADEKNRWPRISDERFELHVSVHDSGEAPVSLPPQLAPVSPEALAKFFHRPVLLTTLARNVRLPVQPLRRIAAHPSAGDLALASQAVLDYLLANPQFLRYRFGSEEGAAMEAGLAWLRDLTRWAADQGYTLAVRPIRRYYVDGEDREIVEDSITPGSRM